MRHKKIAFIVGLVAVLAVVLWWLLKPSERSREAKTSVPSASAQASASPASASAAKASSTLPRKSDAAYREEAIGKVQAVFGTPIAFYGKIIDQTGNPVPDAKVDYSAIDEFFGNGSNYHGKSDANGMFSISGIKGAVLTVAVSKDGYYNISKKSDAAFAYGLGSDATRKEPPTKETPAVFVLQKKGMAEPMIRISKHILLPRNGESSNIDLTTGTRGSRNDLQIQTWVGDSSQQRFDWRYRLSVPGGGLVERKGQFDFEAPTDGYQPSIEVNMPASAEQWTDRPTKEYFAKLSDGKYARFTIRFYAGDRNFIVFESYLNPKSGSRNLEFDPTSAVKSP
jgi:hypothetical protein